MKWSLALLQSALGVLLATSASWVAARVPGPSEEAAPAPAPSSLPPLGQTLRSGEPRELIGPAFDDDAALPRAAKRIASYTLSARLDAPAHKLTATGEIVWENASTRPAEELYFHLYLNAFKNNRTVFSRSPFGAGRSGNGTKHWGYVDVKHLRVREMDGADVWPKNLAAASDTPEDETDIRVVLPRAAFPGETLHLDVEFEDTLPEIVERTGYVRGFHMIGQWFPKLAVRDADGVWAHFPFHAQSEFYADYGTYDVSLDVPSYMVVGATGERVSETTSGDRRHLRYHADDVHDFAWTAWEHFLERAEKMGDVQVRVLYPPGNEANAQATLAAVRHGLAFYGAAFGRYPYPTLTVVHPPVFAPAASGMEYPTLITTGFPWYAAYASNLVERVTLHELGHQWFYGLVGTNEHAVPFLDEGLTTYAEGASMDALFGSASGFRSPGLAVNGSAYERVLAAEAGHDDIVARAASDFVNFRTLGALVYARTGTILSTLGKVYGEDGVRRAVGRYARYYRFEHPGPRHFVAAVREVMGDEPAEFLQSALFEGATVDFVARDLKSTRAQATAGIFDNPGGRTELPSPKSEDEKWLGRVVVYRHGALRLPVDVEFRLEDGSRIRKTWDGRARFASIECEGASPIVSATVDPDLKVLLDDDLTNNAALTRTGSAPRLTERALYAAELLGAGFGP